MRAYRTTRPVRLLVRLSAFQAEEVAEWRLLFALSRYGGLRCPSEHLSMRWGDVDWANNRVRVPSPKTEHIEGKKSRMIPMFPELKPYLEEAFEQAAPGTEFVINRYRSCNANLRTQLMRIIKRAGMKPWPKPFQNLRSTRETELMEKFLAHVVCGWIGNSEAIALKHYLQVTDDHFERAVRGEAEIGPEVAPTVTNTPANPAAQKAAQHAHAGGSNEQHAALFINGKMGATNAKAPGLPGPATSYDTVNTCAVSPRGVELGAQLSGKTTNSQPRGAQSGALAARGQLDAEMSAQGGNMGQSQIDVALVVVIQAWPRLTQPLRDAVLAIVRAR